MRVDVTHYTDPGCPWAYSASPAIAALMWRFGDRLSWRHVMIGLAEDGERYARSGYTPVRRVKSNRRFERWGMPFSMSLKPHISGTSRGCRAIIAVRLQDPEREWAALRALQFMQFTTAGTLDDDAFMRAALETVPGVDADAAIAAIDSADVLAAYEADRAAARTAEGTPTDVQGKTAATDGPVRYTAPSISFTYGDRTLEAGGFQPLQAYDVVLANLAPELERRTPPEDIAEVLAAFPDGLTTAEVAEIYTSGPAAEVDRVEIEDRLLEATFDGRLVRETLGDGDRWFEPASYPGKGWLPSDTSTSAAFR